MNQYTCDRCKSVIDLTRQTRYIVHVEVHSVADSPDEPSDMGDVDSLSLLHQMLEGIESQPMTTDDGLDGESFSSGMACEDRSNGIRQSSQMDPPNVSAIDISDDDLPPHRAQYELCPTCYRMYLRNPLGRDLSPVLQFSKN
jgi:hypothetical protein